MFGDGSAEANAVVGGDRDVRGEPFFRVQCLHAIGDAVVGEQSRRFEIVERPTFGPVVSTGDLMCEVFDGAVAGFAGAVVGRRVRG